MACQKTCRKAKRDRHGSEPSKTEQTADIFFHGDGVGLSKRFLDHVVEIAKPFIDPHINLNLNPE